ncbi:hypothetical protein FKP32DRAFT_1058782 [Trametes sanguinea]|nr:hypothetical protein FKP32DRAFT_1058782 [Trametes sanguinea]
MRSAIRAVVWFGQTRTLPPEGVQQGTLVDEQADEEWPTCYTRMSHCKTAAMNSGISAAELTDNERTILKLRMARADKSRNNTHLIADSHTYVTKRPLVRLSAALYDGEQSPH